MWKGDRMSWKNILKKEYPPMEEMIRELWKDWFYNDVGTFEEHEFEQGSLYEDNYDPHWSREFSKIVNPMEKLDPINDVDKIERYLQKLTDHPSLPMETMSYPTIGLDHDEEDIRAEYDEIRDD